MGVEVFAIVTFNVTPPLSQEDKDYLAQNPEEGDFYATVRERRTEYHFCKCKLVQPIPKPRKGQKQVAVPVPKWEVVEDLLYLSEERMEFYRIKTGVMYYVTLEPKPYDPYGDCRVTDRHISEAYRPSAKGKDLLRNMPNYELHWDRFFGGEKIAREEIETAVDNGAKFLPLRHPIDDRRIQLKQIRFLFPETAVMPLSIALDYVRDKL